MTPKTWFLTMRTRLSDRDITELKDAFNDEYNRRLKQEAHNKEIMGG